MLYIDITSSAAGPPPEGVSPEWLNAYLTARALHVVTEFGVCIMVAEDCTIEGFALTFGDRVLWAVPISCPEQDVECLLGDFCEWIDSLRPAEA